MSQLLTAQLWDEVIQLLDLMENSFFLWHFLPLLMAGLMFCWFRQVSSPSLQAQSDSSESSGSTGLEWGWQWQYLSVALPFQTVLLRGQETAETFAFSPSSSWELEKVLLLMDKPQGIILPEN